MRNHNMVSLAPTAYVSMSPYLLFVHSYAQFIGESVTFYSTIHSVNFNLNKDTAKEIGENEVHRNSELPSNR